MNGVSLRKAVDPPRLIIVDGFTEVVESTEVMSVDSPMLIHRYCTDVDTLVLQINTAQIAFMTVQKFYSCTYAYLDSFSKFSPRKKKKKKKKSITKFY